MLWWKNYQKYLIIENWDSLLFWVLTCSIDRVVRGCFAHPELRSQSCTQKKTTWNEITFQNLSKASEAGSTVCTAVRRSHQNALATLNRPWHCRNTLSNARCLRHTSQLNQRREFPFQLPKPSIYFMSVMVAVSLLSDMLLWAFWFKIRRTNYLSKCIGNFVFTAYIIPCVLFVFLLYKVQVWSVSHLLYVCR